MNGVHEKQFQHVKQAAQDSDPWQKGHNVSPTVASVYGLQSAYMPQSKRKELKQSPLILLRWRDRVQRARDSQDLWPVRQRGGNCRERDPQLCRGGHVFVWPVHAWEETTRSQGRNRGKGVDSTFLGAHTGSDTGYNPKNNIALVMGPNCTRSKGFPGFTLTKLKRI